MKAAKELKRVLKVSDVVFIATGWPDRPHINPMIAETDGPLGAVILGRALHRGLKVFPFFPIEANLVKSMEMVVQSAGFKILKAEEAIAAVHSSYPIRAATVLELLPFGKKCFYPCGSEIAPAIETDLLITSTFSNWGAYGLARCLAILLKKPDVFHDPDIEKWVLQCASYAGFIDRVKKPYRLSYWDWMNVAKVYNLYIWLTNVIVCGNNLS